MSLTPYSQIDPLPITLDLTPISSGITFTLSGVTARGGSGAIGNGYGKYIEYSPSSIGRLNLNVVGGSPTPSATSSNWGFIE